MEFWVIPTLEVENGMDFKNDDSESTIPPSSGDMVLEINIPRA